MTCYDCIHCDVCYLLIKDGMPYVESKHPAEIFCTEFECRADFSRIVRCRDCILRGNPILCPMCTTEYYYDEDDDGDYDLIDSTVDDGFCDRGTRGDDER